MVEADETVQGERIFLRIMWATKKASASSRLGFLKHHKKCARASLSPFEIQGSRTPGFVAARGHSDSDTVGHSDY